MILAYTAIIRLKVCSINIEVQKIYKSIFPTYSIVFTSFQVENKYKRVCFFEETFLIASTIIEVVLKIFFLAFNKVKINFAN